MSCVWNKKMLTSVAEYTKRLDFFVVGQYPLLPWTIAAEVKFPIVGPTTHDYFKVKQIY